ncbi:MAG TPA: hypothetical protein VKV15_15435 [Bryobacteraceae bacterium]|nr:hypothetical protein [Bryobacteraceae bacterium]
METFLNLVWLAVTVAAVCLWRYRWAGSRQHPTYSRRMEVVAIICVLALLFPVISLTDDLHPEMVPADTVSSKRNHCLLAAQGPHAAHSKSSLNAHSFFAIPGRAPSGFEPVFAGIVSAGEVLPSRFLSAPGSGRSPPSLV